MRRRGDQEREDADAREQAELRREALLARLKAREAAGRSTGAPEEVEEPAPAQPEQEEEPASDDAAPAEAE